LILTFRQVGQAFSTASTVVFEVDIGQASLYYGAAAGSSFTVSGYDPNGQLLNFFDNSLDNVGWSVSGCVPNAGDNGSPSKPTRTLWLTDPRSNPNVQAPAWKRQSTFTQGATDSKIVTLLNNALYWSTVNPGDAVTNTATALAIPAGNGYNSIYSIGALGNFGGTFLGNGSGLNDIENITDANFDLEGTVSRSDLYELQPGSGAGTYLGYFELGDAGTLTFNAASVVVYPAPTLSITYTGGNALISFQSVAGGHYTLYATNPAGLTTPVSTWTPSGTLVGDGAVDSFPPQSVNPGSAMFYSVTVH
jgi:hypothetical protein